MRLQAEVIDAKANLNGLTMDLSADSRKNRAESTQQTRDLRNYKYALAQKLVAQGVNLPGARVDSTAVPALLLGLRLNSWQTDCRNRQCCRQRHRDFTV